MIVICIVWSMYADMIAKGFDVVSKCTKPSGNAQVGHNVMQRMHPTTIKITFFWQFKDVLLGTPDRPTSRTIMPHGFAWLLFPIEWQKVNK